MCPSPSGSAPPPNCAATRRRAHAPTGQRARLSSLRPGLLILRVGTLPGPPIGSRGETGSVLLLAGMRLVTRPANQASWSPRHLLSRHFGHFAISHSGSFGP
eukprot:9489426-Pyramimonas_sp.AAC.1